MLLTAHQVGELAVPVVLGAAIDAAVGSGSVPALLLWLAVLAADFAVLSLSWRFGARFGARVRLGVAADLRLAVAERLLDPATDGGDVDAGALTVAATDARRVGEAVRSVLGAAAGLVVVLGAGVVIGRTSPWLAVIVLGTGLAVVLVVAALSGPVESASAAEQEVASRVAALAVDLVAGLRVLVGLHATATAAARYRRSSREAVGHAVRAADAGAVVAAVTACAIGLALAGIAAVTVALGMHGTLTVGEVVAVLGLSQLLLDPLGSVCTALPAVRRGRASAGRIRALVVDGVPVAVADLALPIDGAPSVTLPDIGLVVAPGTIAGVVTDDARTADRIVTDLAGDRGAVLVDRVDLRGLPALARRGAVLAWRHGTVPPDRTVGGLVGAGRAPDATVGRAVRAAGAADVVARLPGGLGEPLGEAASGLSGGELQRLTLARLLVEDPPVLVLHEPTSAVDAVTETLVAAGVREARAGRTTIVVTTSPAFLASCDRVSFVAGSRVVRIGSHRELLGDAAYRDVVARTGVPTAART